MSVISFACAAPVASWTPSINPERGDGYQRNIRRLQPQGFSDDGTLYSYSHGEKTGRTLKWGMLPSADMATLLTFMDLMHGGVHTFTLTDYDTTTYTARIINFLSFPYTHMSTTAYEVMLELEVS